MADGVVIACSDSYLHFYSVIIILPSNIDSLSKRDRISEEINERLITTTGTYA